jgi:hypothetical protein
MTLSGSRTVQSSVLNRECTGGRFCVLNSVFEGIRLLMANSFTPTLIIRYSSSAVLVFSTKARRVGRRAVHAAHRPIVLLPGAVKGELTAQHHGCHALPTVGS